MPRNVRNFWLELEVDGKKTMVKTGPAAKDGGFVLGVFMRSHGGVKRVGTLEGRTTFSDPERLILKWNGSTLADTER